MSFRTEEKKFKRNRGGGKGGNCEEASPRARIKDITVHGPSSGVGEVFIAYRTVRISFAASPRDFFFHPWNKNHAFFPLAAATSGRLPSLASRGAAILFPPTATKLPAGNSRKAVAIAGGRSSKKLNYRPRNLERL